MHPCHEHSLQRQGSEATRATVCSRFCMACKGTSSRNEQQPEENLSAGDMPRAPGPATRDRHRTRSVRARYQVLLFCCRQYFRSERIGEGWPPFEERHQAASLFPMKFMGKKAHIHGKESMFTQTLLKRLSTREKCYSLWCSSNRSPGFELAHPAFSPLLRGT